MSHLSFLKMNLLFALNLVHLLFKLLLFVLQSLLFSDSSCTSVSRIPLILNFFLLLDQFSFKAHFFAFMCLAHGQARPSHLLGLELFELLNLILLCEVLLIACLLGLFLGLLLFAHGIVFQALLTQVSLLLTNLLDSVNPRLLL